ncbi:MAG: hypothetical protein PVI93_06615, partial [Desulfobacterales bacterium]
MHKILILSSLARFLLYRTRRSFWEPVPGISGRAFFIEKDAKGGRFRAQIKNKKALMCFKVTTLLKMLSGKSKGVSYEVQTFHHHNRCCRAG